ncbi:MAG: hypothetical protein ACRDZM_04640 [Acidimicrobiia bacterium]
MRWKPPVGALLFIALIPLAASQAFGAGVSLTLLAVGIGAGWLWIPGFWRNSLHGAMSGVIAGLLVLGPGLRLAMRVVAILDPIRSPEFTVGGTLFILIGVGAVFGGIFGVIGSISRVGFGLPSRASGWVPALLVGLIIAVDSELRSEIVELGAGPWLNIPMFAGVAIAYGLVWTWLMTRIERRRMAKKQRQYAVEGATMTATNPRGSGT